MGRFAETMTDEAIVVTRSQQLSWSHFLALLPIKDPLARDFYAKMCRIEYWDIRIKPRSGVSRRDKNHEGCIQDLALGLLKSSAVGNN